MTGMQVRLDIPWADVLARSDDREANEIVRCITDARLGDVSVGDLIALIRSVTVLNMSAITEVREHNSGDYL